MPYEQKLHEFRSGQREGLNLLHISLSQIIRPWQVNIIACCVIFLPRVAKKTTHFLVIGHVVKNGGRMCIISAWTFLPNFSGESSVLVRIAPLYQSSRENDFLAVLKAERARKSSPPLQSCYFMQYIICTARFSYIYGCEIFAATLPLEARARARVCVCVCVRVRVCVSRKRDR